MPEKGGLEPSWELSPTWEASKWEHLNFFSKIIKQLVRLYGIKASEVQRKIKLHMEINLSMSTIQPKIHEAAVMVIYCCRP